MADKSATAPTRDLRSVYTRPLPERTTITRIKGVFFFLTLLVGGLYTCFLVLPVFALLAIVDVPAAQRLLDTCVSCYLLLPVSLLETFGVGIRCYGDSIADGDVGEMSVIIANHPTTADWMFLWHWLHRFGALSQLKIVLKAPLRRAPIIGWALSLACHVFLDRHWESDQPRVKRLIQHFIQARQSSLSPLSSSSSQSVTQSLRKSLYSLFGRPSLQLLIFPEGTNLRDSVKHKSDEYARISSNNNSVWQRPYVHVLHPRTTGLVYIVQTIRAVEQQCQTADVDRVQSFYDLTVAFPHTQITDIGQLFAGYFPREIAFHCKKFSFAELKNDEKFLEEFVQQRFSEKENLLESMARGQWRESELVSRRFGPKRLVLRGLLVGYAIFIVWFTVMMWRHSWLRWLALLQTVVWMLINTVGGGADNYILKLEDWQQSLRSAVNDKGRNKRATRS